VLERAVNLCVKRAFRSPTNTIPNAPRAKTDSTRSKESQKLTEIAFFVLYFKDNNLAGVNLTFFEDLYLPLFVGDGRKFKWWRG
jgi:hypothetical protein